MPPTAGDWFAFSERYRNRSHWRRAELRLRASDPRVLILAPGRNHPEHRITTELVHFLGQVGFSPQLLERNLAFDELHGEASNYPRILAVPVSVGVSTEVIDFLGDEQLRDRVSVVLPKRYDDGYFAQLLQHRHAVYPEICTRETFDPDDVFDQDLGEKCLHALAAMLLKAESARRAEQVTEHNDQAGSFRALAPVTEPGTPVVVAPPPASASSPAPLPTERRPGRALAIYSAVAVGALVVGGGSYRLLGGWGALIVLLFFALFAAAVLEQQSLLSDRFASVVQAVTGPIGSLFGASGNPELPSGSDPTEDRDQR